MSQLRMVLNLRTGERWYYDRNLSARKAIVNARQQSEGDWNWWNYDYGAAEIGPSGQTMCCGDWATILGPEERE